MTLDRLSALLALIADVFAAAALIGLGYLALSLFAMLRARQPAPPAAPPPPGLGVTVLAPLCGAETGLYERLAALCQQAYGGPLQLVCGVAGADDPALAVARQVRADFPERAIDLVVDARQHGPNRKVSNLINMLALARHETLVMLDSDIVVRPGYLACVVGELQRPGVGAVTCLYYGLAGDDGIWSRLSSMSLNMHFLANVLAGLRFGRAKPCFGATIALSRTLLGELGGLEPFATRLCEDYAIGEAVRRRGLAVRVSSFAVGHVCLEQSARELVESQLRRARTIRAIDPLGAAGLIVSHAFSLALIALLLGQPYGLALLAAATALRLAQCHALERAYGLPRQPYLALPARELLSFCVYLVALARGPVVWRGRRYRVSRSGDMVPVETPAVSRARRSLRRASARRAEAYDDAA